MRKLYEETDFKNISCFHLLLGPQCNMHCRHCIQTGNNTFIEKENVNFSISEKTKSTLFNWIDYVIYRKPNCVNKVLPVLNFWGGEPLIFYKVIREVILSCVEKFGQNIISKIHFMLTTNGLLLTEEIVDFFNKYRIEMRLSYDAPHPFIVRDYLPYKICELANKVERLRIISCGNAINCDPLLAYRCVKSVFPNALSYYSDMIDIVSSFPLPKDVTDYDYEKVKTNLRKIRIALHCSEDMREQQFCFRYFYRRIFLNNNKVYSLKELDSFKLVMGDRGLAVSLDGKVPAHINKYGLWIGCVDDTLSDICKKSYDYYAKIYDSDCESCKYKSICIENCCYPIAIRDNNNHIIDCKKFRYRYFELFEEEAMKLQDKPTLEEIAWFKKQEKIMEKEIKNFQKERKMNG